MSAQSALKSALKRIVGPVVREAGYKRSGNTWRRVNERGDWAIMNVQSSSWSTSEELRCIINISVAPQPWLVWTSHLSGQEMPTAPKEASGLYRNRIHPTGSPAHEDTWWTIRNESDAEAAATDMVEKITVEALPILANLLDRSNLVESLRKKDLGMIHGADWDLYFMQAEAILRADEGVSSQLESILKNIDQQAGAKLQSNVESLVTWVRSRAAEADLRESSVGFSKADRAWR